MRVMQPAQRQSRRKGLIRKFSLWVVAGNYSKCASSLFMERWVRARSVVACTPRNNAIKTLAWYEMWRCLSQEKGWRACCGAAGLQGAALKMYFEYDACFSSTLSFPGAFGGFQEGKNAASCALSLSLSFAPSLRGHSLFRSPFLSGAIHKQASLTPLSKHQTRITHTDTPPATIKRRPGPKKSTLRIPNRDPSWNCV